MITKNDAAVPGQSVSVEGDTLEIAVPATGSRRVQPDAAANQPLAQGSNPEHNVILHMKGATDVLQADLIFQPGASAGWHFHPGPVVVVIQSGKLTEIHSNGCITVHDAGSAFFESPGEVHNVVNQGGVVTEVFATFLSPVGSQPLIPAANPGNVCRGDH